MVWEIGVQSFVESYQRLKKWYLMPPCLTLSIKKGSRAKWSNLVVAIEKRAFGSPSTKAANFTLFRVFKGKVFNSLYTYILNVYDL